MAEMLMDYYAIAKLLKFRPFRYFLPSPFWASRACVMALISVRVAWKLQQLVRSSSGDREKVAEELLLCEVMVQYRYA
jgi:hypothetical protein